MELLQKSSKATCPQFTHAQHRSDGVYHRSDPVTGVPVTMIGIAGHDTGTPSVTFIGMPGHDAGITGHDGPEYAQRAEKAARSSFIEWSPWRASFIRVCCKLIAAKYDRL